MRLYPPSAGDAVTLAGWRAAGQKVLRERKAPIWTQVQLKLSQDCCLSSSALVKQLKNATGRPPWVKKN